MAADSGPLAAGQLFAGCRVHRLIARGGLGALYAAADEAGGEWRALKVLSPVDGLSKDAAADAARRFAQEAGAAERLQHPGIVRVYRAGAERGMAYLVMELLAGCDLTRYTQRTRLLPECTVLQVVERVARALAHAHAQGIVHRDLKPANVMVDWASDRVTLTDFGVARVADAERTRTGLVLGSPAYMAPELLAGQAADAGTDLYALGVMLYQLLTAELPFDAPALGELLRRVATEPAPDLRQKRPDMSATLADPLAALVTGTLAKERDRRPADAAALADALAKLRGVCG